VELYRSHVLVCGGTGCTSSGSQELIEALNKEIERLHLSKEVKIVQTGCLGLCERGPNVIIYPEGAYYCRVKPEDARDIAEEHLFKGRIVQRLLYRDIAEEHLPLSLNEVGFYSKQKRIVLKTAAL